jgi:AcrR family transcriptional regulator
MNPIPIEEKMPPKFKFTKEQIIKAAFKIVRESGWKTLTTRSLAGELGSSARPIYSFFKSMVELEEEVSKKGVDLLYDYMIPERTGDPWQDHGIGYVLFAQNEKCLFRSLNDDDHIKYFKAQGETIWKTLTELLSDYPPFKGLTEEQIYQIQLARWLLAHGLAVQVSTHPPGVWEDDKVVLIIRQGSTAILEGFKQQFMFQNK